MIYGLYHSAAGMLTHEYRQDVLANNLANADTAGFKRQIASLAERLPARLAGVRSGEGNDRLALLSGGLWQGRTATDFSPGSMQQTGSPLDVALDGPGFLLVEAQGKPYLTRDGRMVMDADGRLRAASDGALILGEGGGPIHLNPYGGTPSIDEEGRISQGGLVVGRLALEDVADYATLQRAGGERFAAPAQRSRATPLVRSGLVESSGVEPVKELVSMIESSRAYQLNAQMLTLQDQTAGRLINLVNNT